MVETQAPQSSANNSMRILRVFVTGAGTAGYIALANWSYGAALADDMTGAVILLIIAWGFVVAGLFVSEELGIFTVKQRFLLNFIVAVVVGALSFAIFLWEKADRPQAPTSKAQDLRVEALVQLSSWLGGGEPGLRVRFDIQNVLVFNINVQTARIRWVQAGNTGQYPYPQPAILHVTKEAIKTVHGRIFPGEVVGPNGANIVEGATDIYFQPVTQQYNQAAAELDAFIASPLVPQDVKQPLSKLKQALTDDMGLMYQILADKKKLDDQYFLLANSQNSKFGYAISNEFYLKMHPLAPPASDALNKIQEHLRTN